MRADGGVDEYNGTHVRVRTRRDADLEACVRALRTVHGTSGYPRNWPADPPGWLCQGGELGAWVAEAPDGDIVGHVALTAPAAGDVAPGLWRAEQGACAQGVRARGAAVVGRLFVAPRGHGHGIGRALLTQVVSCTDRLGLWPVLDVVAVDPAVAFYERIGWRRLGTGEQNWGAGELVDVHCYAAPGPAGYAAPSRPALLARRTTPGKE
ncbi:GNAT family N-acetyltransferase [Streptomyces sp. NPDC091272]|uniref:GNAT family N-acetyltransferase n=1 Tax=Streptomyces sp. NPDC091272 TaxID=3365981 RepID=UPI003817F5A5